VVNGNVGFGKDEMCSYKHTHNGAVHTGTNYLNPGNPMSIVTNPSTDKSLIIDNVTKEVIQLGGKGFKY
tara:strand:- start:11099 stop:11305 length:207 start_codon:yes stop_codon:yes gene_type:complete